MVHQENCTVVDTIHALRCSTVGPHPDKWSISGRIAGSSISASISSCISNGIFVNSSITIGHRPSASSRPRSPWPSLVSAKSPSMHRQKSNFKQHKNGNRTISQFRIFSPFNYDPYRWHSTSTVLLGVVVTYPP